MDQSKILDSDHIKIGERIPSILVKNEDENDDDHGDDRERYHNEDDKFSSQKSSPLPSKNTDQHHQHHHHQHHHHQHYHHHHHHRNRQHHEKAITPFWRRFLILIFTFIETIIFSGLIFGWPLLFYMLKQERIYAELCDRSNSSMFDDSMMEIIPDVRNIATTTTTTTSPFFSPLLNQSDQSSLIDDIAMNCVAQENLLNLAFTIGIFAMGFTSFAWGFLLESKGLRFVRNALNFLISLGCFLLSITTEEYSYLILPAIIILGLIGVPLRIANMQIADFFPTKRSTIISFYSGAFSSSPLVFVIIKSIYDRYEIGYFHSTIILFIISITLIPLNTIILPKRSVRNRERILLNRFEEYRYKQMALEFGSQNENPKKNCCDGGEEKCDPNAIGTNVCVTMKPFFITKKSLQKLTDQILEQENGNDEILLPENVGDRKKPIIVNFTELQKEKDRKNFKQTQQAERSVGKKILHSLFCLRRKKHAAADDDDGDGGNQLKVSLFSLSYLIHQIWFGWINTYMVLYSGSMSLWLDRITDDPSVRNYFARIFGIVQILALIIAPCAGYLMDKIVRRARDITDDDHRRLIQAQSGSLPILFTTLTLAGAVCCRFFDSNQAIYISIVFITILRALFIAVASAYLRIRYPASHFNRLNGIMCTVGAFFSLLQFPLFYVESNFRIGSIWVNGFSALMTLLCLLHPLSLRTESIQVYLIRREEHHARKIIKKKSQRKQNLVLNY